MILRRIAKKREREADIKSQKDCQHALVYLATLDINFDNLKKKSSFKKSKYDCKQKSGKCFKKRKKKSEMGKSIDNLNNNKPK